MQGDSPPQICTEVMKETSEGQQQHNGRDQAARGIFQTVAELQRKNKKCEALR
jgi:hypothetical protein